MVSALEIDKIRLIKLFTLAGAPVLYLVAAFHFVSGDSSMAVFEALIATGGVLNLILLKISGSIRLSENFILLGMVLLLSGILIHGGYERTGIYWIFTYPLLSFFLKGKKTGFLWSGALFFIVLFLVFLEYMKVVPLAYTPVEIRQALMAYTIVVILAYIFEDALLRSYNEVSRMAITDQLTGLYNRRYIMKKLEEEIKRARRYTKKLCVILLDVDNFKNINDRFGHDVGDFVLQEIAKVLREKTREIDTVGRLGGEEFVIICPEIGKEEGKVVAEKIRCAVEKMEIPFPSKISVSIGVAEFSGYENPFSLLKKADIALYKAKKTGKNRVEVFSYEIPGLRPERFKIKKPAP